jgi:hypothetical protein
MIATTQDKLKNLYETDDYLWLQKTLQSLRNNDLHSLDIENLIEELEGLGKSHFSKVRSLLRQIIVHLLLLEYWQEEYEWNHRHWVSEIIAFRDDLNNNLTTTLRIKLNQELESVYAVSRRLVIAKTGLNSHVFPNQCPYLLDNLLDENWLP